VLFYGLACHEKRNFSQIKVLEGQGNFLQEVPLRVQGGALRFSQRGIQKSTAVAVLF